MCLIADEKTVPAHVQTLLQVAVSVARVGLPKLVFGTHALPFSADPPPARLPYDQRRPHA